MLPHKIIDEHHRQRKYVGKKFRFRLLSTTTIDMMAQLFETASALSWLEHHETLAKQIV